MKRLTIAMILVLALASVATGQLAAKVTYINLTTGKQATELPKTVASGTGVMNPATLEACAKDGWREMSKEPATPEGYIRTGIAWEQDSKNPLKAVAVLQLKSVELQAQEDAAAKAAQEASQAAYEADYQTRRSAITKAFADEKQAKAIGELFDAIHGRVP